MTNGEKLCIDFPNMHYTLSEKQPRRVVTTIGVCASFDLDWWNAEYKELPTKNDLGVDYISRDSAIKALGYDIKSFEFKSGVSKYMDDIAKLLDTIYEIQVNNIKALPSVTPIRPKGHWIEHEKSISTAFKHLRECSCCKCYFDWMMPRNSFCPNCGARMIEPQESEE